MTEIVSPYSSPPLDLIRKGKLTPEAQRQLTLTHPNGSKVTKSKDDPYTNDGYEPNTHGRVFLESFETDV